MDTINKNMMEQLGHLTMGQIAELTEQKKVSLEELKHLDNIEEESENISAQDFINSVDTKIRRPRFDTQDNTLHRDWEGRVILRNIPSFSLNLEGGKYGRN